jgi:tetratricopeptide (TPR) repeat protein
MEEPKRSRYEPVIRTPEEWVAARDGQAAEAKRERARADRLWRRLTSIDRREWRDRVLGDPEFQVWTFCEKLCDESAALADDDPAQAFKLAQLALELVPKIPGDEKLLCGIQRYIWMHLGNAFRSLGNLEKTEESLKRAGEFLVGSFAGSLPSLIRHDRLAMLEAALLRDKGDLAEALRKIQHAFPLTGESPLLPFLFWEEGRLYRRLGRHEKALEALERAERACRKATDRRLLARIQIELGNVRCDLGRHAEIKEVPGSIRKAAESFPLERVRLLCLKGRVAAGLGRVEEARSILDQACTESHPRAVPELVLLSLESGAIYARQERTAELKSLAEQTLRLVEAHDLGREAEATLKLWCKLAAQDKLRFERATQFVSDWTRFAAAR